MSRRYGAIAIGSNSTRLLVADKKDGMLRNIHRGRAETRLFMGLTDEGMIAPEKIQSTARAVAELYKEALAHGAQEVTLFATSATRDAKNGHELALLIEALCGLSLQVISGQEEAALAFRAVAGAEKRLVMDIGGGSTEFTIGEKGMILASFSAQLGASRLLKKCPIESWQDALRARRTAEDILRPELEKIRPFMPVSAMVGMGGSCTTAAAIEMGYEAHGEEVEGKIVTLSEAERQLQLLSSMSLEERKKVPGLPEARAVHMPHGLCILIAALALCGQEEMIVSGRTNLDGYLLERE